MELMDLTMEQATEYAIARIMEEFGFNRKTATEYFKNALTYNVVINEIVDQVDYITAKEEEGEE